MDNLVLRRPGGRKHFFGLRHLGHQSLWLLVVVLVALVVLAFASNRRR